jgi:hypothetical protein
VSLSCSTAIRNLTSQVQTLQYTNNTDDAMVCQVVMYLGDGVNDLDGSGGDYELTIQFGDQVNMPDPQLVYFSTSTRASIFTEQFVLPIGQTVTTKIKSPNVADTSVYTHACIYEVSELSKMSYATGGSNTIVNTYEDSGGVYA